MTAAGPTRNAQLDLLRALAIAMVVTFHLIQMSPVWLGEVMPWVEPGAYGVDLFFVLSGWLIGGLFWQETARHGDVQTGRFWLRRALRTVPPYYAALALSWGAVYAQRHEPLPLGYLVFAQNYYGEIPFFLVSWSLCIEEHFYALVPLALSLVGPGPSRRGLLLGALLLCGPLGRWFDPAAADRSAFGYWWTATHLRLDGLLLGFVASAVPLFRPDLWARLQARKNMLLGGALVLLGIAFPLTGAPRYYAGPSMLAVGFLALLIAVVERPAGRIAQSRVVHAVALASYSTYLVHALVLHAARVVTGRLPEWAWPSYFVIAIGLMAVSSTGFHLAIERGAITWRDRLVPRRSPRLAPTAATLA